MARYLRRCVGGALALGLVGGDPVGAQQGMPVDLELVLAIDTSGSVDPWEFSLQLEGIAAAFRDAEVQAAIAGSMPGGRAVTLVQWSSPKEQLATTGWTVLTDTASVEAYAAKIEANGRQFMGRTAIASALDFAIDLLAGNGFEGYRKVIDLSGDGRANEGRVPAVSARDFEDFARAIRQKLIREIRGTPVGAAPGAASARTRLAAAKRPPHL